MLSISYIRKAGFILKYILGLSYDELLLSYELCIIYAMMFCIPNAIVRHRE